MAVFKVMTSLSFTKQVSLHMAHVSPHSNFTALTFSSTDRNVNRISYTVRRNDKDCLMGLKL